ncbi:DUF6090 family protein [Draconibacterium sp. IB214405]|uniref:DUF6090 family protein n=1 Tax=Draconibacterium sp. IB214405 TaxID=3097352 RepID=UPI002A16D14B|nr:DUF6090 family protein [Draconibacterium sp. IB214405]MDX8337885.1 DUF6090 family protein [Draconibacterium sp. IB214405]
MLRFFSKMRYKLATENRVVKYMRYAVGEILLVVIGIVIALQINNWNEQRKIHIYEHKIISDLLVSLDNDLGIYYMLLGRIDSMEFGVSNLYRLMGKNESSADSLQKYLPYLSMGIRFGYDPGTYESLKSVGLDKITDDAIRAELARLYDFLYPRINSMIDFEYKQPANKAKELLDKFWISGVEVKPNGEASIVRRVEIKDPFHNQDFLNGIKLYSNTYKNARNRIEFIINESEKVKESLEKYIKKQMKR